MNILKFASVLLLSIIIFAVKCYADDMIDVIILKDKTIVKGIILEQYPNDKLKIKTDSGDVREIKFSEIENIMKEEKPLEVKKGVTELGIVAGSPAGLNILLGHSIDDFIFKLSGLYVGKIYGIQVNLGLMLSNNINRYHSLNFIAGSSFSESNLSKNTWDYFGIAYNLNYKDFYLEAGISSGSGSYSNPQIMLQIGYVYRFLD